MMAKCSKAITKGAAAPGPIGFDGDDRSRRSGGVPGSLAGCRFTPVGPAASGRQRGAWTDEQMAGAVDLAGGEGVEDLRLLEKDEGLGRVLRLAETQGMRRRERRGLLGRWRRERRRSVPSASAVFRFLQRFHDPARREDGFIPADRWVARAGKGERRLGGLRPETAGMSRQPWTWTPRSSRPTRSRRGIATRSTRPTSR